MDIKTYKQVVSKFTTGVIVVTGNYNKYFGITINSFSSVSLEPTLIAFNIDKKASTYKLIKNSNYYNLNFLSQLNQHYLKQFAKPSIDKFLGVNYQLDQNNIPILNNNLALLRVKKYKIYPAGDHDMILAKVINGTKNDKLKPLIYYNAKIHD
jgi:flavin reductase (DIM6/NTAB) family NADH-FMN oxidoreductase RutF